MRLRLPRVDLGEYCHGVIHPGLLVLASGQLSFMAAVRIFASCGQSRGVRAR